MLKPLVKYPGGKERELKYIIPNLPHNINRYYEPFVGGGAVYFAIQPKAKEYLINDKSRDLTLLYKAVRKQDEDFFAFIADMNKSWKASSIEAAAKAVLLWPKFSKVKSESYLKEIENLDYSNELLDCFDNEEIVLTELKNNITRKVKFLFRQEKKGKKITEEGFTDIINTAFKSAVYMYYRYLYNLPENNKTDSEKAALYLFIRQYAYGSMFRFSKSGKFNVPYGGKSYNNIFLGDKVKYYRSEKLIDYLNNSIIENKDFEDFLTCYVPRKEDFLFIDPPYDSDFSKYDNNAFDAQEQRRLANYLINKTMANWMIVIKDSPLVRKLYRERDMTANGEHVYINDFKKKYSVNFKNRNSQKTRHLIITNYALN